MNKKSTTVKLLTTTLALSAIFSSHLYAEESAEELAKKLSNPVAALISIPIKFNFDENIGADDKGSRNTITVQPVIPFDINDEWNVISRTIIPIVSQTDITGLPDEDGLGDIIATNWLSPKAPSASGWIWGVGPVLSLPTASKDILGTEKFSAGPSALALKQEGQITYGFLVHHLWSVAGEDNRADVSNTFMQPFFAYATKTGMSFSVNTETTYDHKAEEWSVPVNAKVSQVMKFGSQLMQFGANLRYWAESPDNGPEGFGVTFDVVFLIPN
ncbi:transporter [Colwelliaceae bacterium BS250]